MGEIILRGDCLVNRAAELHRLLHHYLVATEEEVEIDLSSAGRCDLSFFQLVCSASRGFNRRNRKISLRGSLPPKVAAQLEKAGFVGACCVCDDNHCLLKKALLEANGNFDDA